MNDRVKRTRKSSSRADCVPQKRSRYFDNTNLLPDEILTYIFSYFDQKELYTIIRLVCRRWYHLASSPTLWKRISAPEEVPSSTLCNWLEQSPLLTELELIGRSDVNCIALKVAKCCRNLQSLKIDNPIGSDGDGFELLESRTLCRMLRNCKYLTNLYFSGVKILSCKFFQILSNRKPAGAKRCCYFGPVSQKQMKALIESVVESDNYDTATLFTSGNKSISIKEVWNDGVRKVDIDSILNDVLNNLDESLEDDEEYVPPDMEEDDLVVDLDL
ncbi:unnamed protein product [Phyllotreta striolata]|uniref:F-box domain-containing protein n=1 Tax=Phyllotreta striolata TaxID=444603 RepID=A0A9N9TSQ3_PHYSR|nr:unnamed protein product [Phyllotreta striolata]